MEVIMNNEMYYPLQNNAEIIKKFFGKNFLKDIVNDILDDDYLCLYYQNNGISIIYWSSERALESKNMAIFQLYSSYEDFVKDCITTKPPHRQA